MAAQVLRPARTKRKAALFLRLGQGHHIGIVVIFQIEIIAKRRQDFFQISLKPFQLDLGGAFFGDDIGQPPAPLVTSAARD